MASPTEEDGTLKFCLRVGMIALTVLVIVLPAMGIYAIVKSITATGQVEYCYVRRIDGQIVSLNGFRSWREDSRLGVYTNVSEAKDAADKLGCSVK